MTERPAPSSVPAGGGVAPALGVLKRRVITTFVPTPGRASLSTSGSLAASAPPAEYAPDTIDAS